ncbi:hypothetical protein DSCO28_33050 [Desulfosarcina ovata subsp. sediminis]|uniref:FtsK domain-containing protein n=1 Tax=Desulfosarcina ovata subsp. sediminis TaxID=885957 RepID=A0A5K7ZQM3_9BACT|nr:DNA translocase FtsK [Desulfosarcina ovata]BBO82739.1 hypothetical protein DSCO28_33050 [Desulfosarcina ovata subsp. sediminis]
MKKNYFRFEDDVLFIHTECGEYKFKIESDTRLTKARQIAELMVAEMDNVEAKFQRANRKSSPYAKMLLANLNMADKYVRLESKYNQLCLEREKMIAGDATVAETVADVPAHLENEPAMECRQPGAVLPHGTPLVQPPTAPTIAPTELEDERALELTADTTPPTRTHGALPPTPPDEPAPDTCEMEVPPSRPEVLPASEEADRAPESATPSVEGPCVEPQSTPTPAIQLTPQDRPSSPVEDAIDGSGGDFKRPSLDFLRKADQEVVLDHEAIRRDAELLEQKLGYFGIKGEVMGVSPGPVITTFEYKPAPGIKISKIVNLANDLALALSAVSIRIVAPIPGKDVIGIEIPNPKMSIVPFVDIVGSEAFAHIDSRTPICLGKDIIGKPVVVGLERMPHLLIAGATGTGKSVALNAMITSILYKSPPDAVKFIMIDPKRIELSLFNDIPHLLTPVIVDMRKANIALQWVVREMERRYENLAALQVRNIEQYNDKVKNADLSSFDDGEAFEAFPYIVVIIDELADLMMTASKDIEFSLTRIAQMARAAGIHLILATQRPSVDVLTGIIKANFPTRISFQVSSKTDSRTIIDSNGAETLLGRGDMLFVPPGTARLTRVHGTYLSEEELITITDFLKRQGKPEYVLDVISEREDETEIAEISEDEYDEKYQEALEFVLSSRQTSISSVQRALRVGYNRAARIIDLMEKKGIVGPSDGIKPRQVLVDRTEWLPY